MARRRGREEGATDRRKVAKEAKEAKGYREDKKEEGDQPFPINRTKVLFYRVNRQARWSGVYRNVST